MLERVGFLTGLLTVEGMWKSLPNTRLSRNTTHSSESNVRRLAPRELKAYMIQCPTTLLGFNLILLILLVGLVT